MWKQNFLLQLIVQLLLLYQYQMSAFIGKIVIDVNVKACFC